MTRAPTQRSYRNARASVHLARTSLPIRRAEQELLQLAGGRASELAAELDRARALVVGQLRAAVLDEIGLARLHRGAQHYQRLHRLAPALVGHADHGDF